MCFSAPASFTAAAALGGVSVYTKKQAKKNPALRYIASIPMLFAVQQATEGFLWLSFGYERLQLFFTFMFLLFALAIWPTYIPYAAFSVEKNPWRRQAIKGLGAIGMITAGILLFYAYKTPAAASAAAGHIDYTLGLPHPYILAGMYIAATCFSLMLSQHLRLRVFGIAALASLTLAAHIYFNFFASVWCFFAAVLSLMIPWVMRGIPTPKNKKH